MEKLEHNLEVRMKDAQELMNNLGSMEKDAFEYFIKERMPNYVRQAYGEKAFEKLVDAILYLAPFAGYREPKPGDEYPPATLDKKALRAAWFPESDQELSLLIQAVVQLGFLEYAHGTWQRDSIGIEKIMENNPRNDHTTRATSIDLEGRFLIREDIANMLKRILAQYDGK